jgi:hypothetical protein
MTPSLKLLLTHRFDYAGLFPPAKLNLGDAVRLYQDYRQSTDAWMLGQFVCPARQLAELQGPVPVSVVGRSGKDEAEFLANLDADLRDIAAYQQRTHAEVGGFELRLPPAPTARLFKTVRQRVDAGIPVFLEAPFTPSLPLQVLRPLAAAGSSMGFKLRCGGLEAAAFPSVEAIAHVLFGCRDLNLPLKLTAGLHHPVRHFDAGLQTPMHGFINLWMASLLTRAHRMYHDDLVAVLNEEDPMAFRFTDDGCSWREWRVTMEQMRQPGSGIVAIGSCSFDEPRDDLRNLGWW